MATSVDRPDPDTLLKQIERDYAENGKGRLKIFLGYASGVGKSVKMLSEGRRRRERGQDVVVGAVQPSASDEVAGILETLEVIPLRVTNGQSAIDMPRLLERRPAICLIDGLAYRNPPGSKHDTRWRDVEELLNAGISVIASINIQFIDELKQRVETITGKHVSDSVPEKFISSADEIVVVDAPPGTCAVRSNQTGFNIGLEEQRLSELRELALLLAADVVDRQLETYLWRNGIVPYIGAQERILICLSPSFNASSMVASASHQAERFHCDLHAVYVREKRLGPDAESRLNANMERARAAGAIISVLDEDDATTAILEYARSKGITQVFVGHGAPRKWWRRFGMSFTDRLIRGADGLDVKIFPH